MLIDGREIVLKLNLKGWKKILSEPEHTTLKNDAGHEIKILHKALSPKMRSQITSMPGMMTKGGEAKDPTQRHLLPGDKIPNQIEKEVVNKAKKMADGGKVKGIGYNVDVEKANKFENANPFGSPAPKQSQVQESDAPVPSNAGPAAQAETRGVVEPEREAPLETMPDNNKPSGESYPSMEAKGGTIKRYAEGTGNVSSSQDSPEQIASDASQQAPQQQAPVIVNVNHAPPAQQQEEPKDNFEHGPGGATFSFDKYALNNPDKAPLETQTKALNDLSQRETAADFAKQQSAQNIKNQVDAYNQAASKQGLPPRPYPPGILDAIPQPGDQSTQKPISSVNPQSDTQTPAQDPMLTGSEAYSTAALSALGEQKQGIQNEAAAQGAMGMQQAQDLKKNIVAQQAQASDFQKHYADLEGERQHWINDLENNRINPNRYVENMSTGSKISTNIGLILGGMGAGLTGGPNYAFNKLQENINRDVDSQKANLGKTQTLLASNLHQFGNLVDATAQTRAMTMDVISNKLKLAAAQATDPLARARAMQQAGQLDMQAATITSQTAMRRAILGQGAYDANGKWNPTKVSRVINMLDYIPKDQKAAANKELQDAQNAVALRDTTLHAYDQIARLNTLGNRAANPLQASRQIDAIKGTALDKLTKDTSGRVTPQTVDLIGSIFHKMGNTQKTDVINRARLNDMLSTGMHYPLLDTLGMSPVKSQSTQIQEQPITGKK